MAGIDLACITRIKRETSRPRLTFQAGWLADMGFVTGALVQFIPEPDGLAFVLCDENIHKYSQLYKRTKEQGGMLMQAYSYRDGLQLCVSNSLLAGIGLVYGDNLIVRYEYGLIRMRKLPKGTVKLVTPHVIGKWLGESGFIPDAVLSVASAPGLIACTLHEDGLQKATELVKYARANKLTLLQVQKKWYKSSVILWFDIPDSCLQKAEFATDETLLATYEYGIIKLQKPDFVQLGF